MIYMIITAVLCIGLGAALSFFVGAVTGIIEYSVHGLKKNEKSTGFFCGI